MFKIKNKHIQLTLIILVAFNFYLWQQIVVAEELSNPTVYFLNVGQGDGQLVLLPSKNGGAIKVLIDGGRDKKIISELDKVFGGLEEKYIDLIVATHADIDHFGGLIEVLRRYDVGAFIYNGRGDESASFLELAREVEDSRLEMTVLAVGDKIKYRGNQFLVLWPRDAALVKDDNEASLVLFLETGDGTALFTGDIGLNTEENILSMSDIDNLGVDVLKVPHHGSKYASGIDFVWAVKPRISVIEVGKNSYSHPTDEVLNRLRSVGSNIYRTDVNGTIKVILDD